MNIIDSRLGRFVLQVALVVAIVGANCASELLADDHAPVVPGYQRFAEVDEFTLAEHGALLLNELNCMACHEGSFSWAMKPKQAPILTDIGSRVFPEYLARFISDPHASKPGTTMPNLLAGKSAEEKSEIAEAISHFLASTGEVTKRGVGAESIKRGETLFHSIGCVACHDPQNSDAHIATSIPLGNLDEKYSVDGLESFIKNPLHVRPSGRMPQFNLNDKEAHQIAAYLLKDVALESRTNFAYYEGRWERLPNFDQLQPKSTGLASGFELFVGDREDEFGIVFTGYWTTGKNAKFRFQVGSDDGSRLIIDGQTVVDNDGTHGMSPKNSRSRNRSRHSRSSP